MTIKTMHCNYSVDWKDDDGDRGCCEIQQRFPSLGLRSLSSSGSNHTFVNKGGEVATKQRGSFDINTVQHALTTTGHIFIIVVGNVDIAATCCI